MVGGGQRGGVAPGHCRLVQLRDGVFVYCYEIVGAHEHSQLAQNYALVLLMDGLASGEVVGCCPLAGDRNRDVAVWAGAVCGGRGGGIGRLVEGGASKTTPAWA